MKLFGCTTKTVTMQIVDLPRQSWKVVPPGKLQVIATLAVIIITAVIWSIL